MWIRGVIAACLALAVTAKRKDNDIMKFLVPREFMGCFKDIKMTPDMIDVSKKCGREAKLRAIVEKLKSKSKAPEIGDIMPTIEEMVSCIQRDQGLLGEDGKIQVQKLLDILNKVEGDETKKTFLKTSTEQCFNSVDSAGITAAKHQLRLMKCCMKKQLQYCLDNKEDPGKLSFIVPMMTLKDPSPCDVVNIVDTVLPFTTRCMEEHGHDKDGDKPRGLGGKKTGRPGRNRRSLKGDPKLQRIQNCIGEEMGFFNETSGIDFTALSDVLATFSGWDTLNQTIKDQVLAGIADCGATAVYTDMTKDEVESKYPWFLDASPHAVQCFRFNKCLLPRFGETCGMRNQLSLFLFPLLHKLYPQSVLQDILGDDFSQKVDSQREEDMKTKPLEDEEDVVVILVGETEEFNL